LGIVKLEDALMMAEDEGLDLVEVAPLADPPVSKRNNGRTKRSSM
jgi:translation initiation factor IF-3